MDNKKEFTGIPKFVREYSFYNSNMFSRYVEKVKIRMFDFIKEYYADVNGKGIEYFNDILIASLFFQIRKRDDFETEFSLSQLILSTQYNCEGLFGLCLSLIDKVNNETIEKAKQQMENDGEDPDIANDAADFKMGENFANFMNFAIAKDGTDPKESFDIYGIVSHSFISACKLFLEGKVIFKNLNKEQINTQALPETAEELYTIYNNTLLIFKDNFFSIFGEISLDNYLNATSTKKNNEYKETINELNAELKDKDKVIKEMKLELMKKSDEEIKSIVKNDDEKIINDLHTEILTLKKQINKLSSEKEALSDANMRLNSELEVANHRIKNLKNHIDEENLVCDFSKRYGFVSQHETLNSKILKAFPNSVIIDKPISSNKVNIDAMVGITKEISHSLYAATKAYAISNNIPYIHCCEINTDKIGECIASNLI